jgi:hypothetical protein
VLLVETVRRTGLDASISAALEPWRKTRAVHDPDKILLDVTLAVTLGGDCLADVALLRAEPAVSGPVTSNPTVSRLVDPLAAGGTRPLTALRAARADVREHVWKPAADAAPDTGGQVSVDLDGVLVLAHFREAGRCCDLEEDLRPPSADGLRRPRPRRVRRAGRGPAAARQRGLRHRRRPHHRRPAGPGPAAETVPAGDGRH